MTRATAVTGVVEPVVLEELSIRDVRCIEAVDVELAPSVTFITGANGEGKTSVLEAIAWLSLGRSFRGAPDKSLVRVGAEAAVIRASVRSGERVQSIEAEVRAHGANRVLLNRNRVARRRDLSLAVPVTVFSPDDLELVKGGPGFRRDYLDDLLSVLAPRYDAARADFERVLRHRNALLRAGGADDLATMGVFDSQLIVAGAELLRGRLRLTERLLPLVNSIYRDLARADIAVTADYIAEYSTTALTEADAPRTDLLLHDALAAGRSRERDRRVTLVGPHRDEWELRIGALASRDQASQGEQRTLAFALRLASHRLIAELSNLHPILLLDDVFSELDDERCRLLIDSLPGSQTLVTAAGTQPAGIRSERQYTMSRGCLSESGRDPSSASDSALSAPSAPSDLAAAELSA